MRGSRTILHVTHHLDELLEADRVLVLGSGHVVARTTPATLFSDPELLAENRLVSPPAQRLAADLGLDPGEIGEPEELAESVLGALGRGATGP